MPSFNCQYSSASALWGQKVLLWQVQVLCSRGSSSRTQADSQGMSTVTTEVSVIWGPAPLWWRNRAADSRLGPSCLASLSVG